MITIDQVSFAYAEGKNSLYDVNLKIHPGECVLLCGESGCGKTTVTKLINGLIPHFTTDGQLQGNVTVAGMPVCATEIYELAKKVGSVFQNPKSQFFHLDTDSELEFGLENEGVPPEKIKSRVETTVRQLKVEKLMHRNIFSLSGGEKQLLAFASVYAMNPEIYTLDEPTANLDEEAIEKLRKQLIRLKEEGKTVVIAEHRLYFLADLVDRAIYIRDGKITKSFSKEEFLALSEQERTSLGLRTLKKTELNLEKARAYEAGKGFGICRLDCGYKGQPDVIKDLSFTVYPGEVLGISGHNGVGKTTLIRCLCGLIREQKGSISLEGDILNRKQRQKNCFLVMQDVNHQLFSDSVFGECEQAGTSDEAGIREVLAQFDLSDYGETHPMALSGGQKQRLAVATAVLSGKKILIFDEPTSGLDYRHMKEVCEMVRNLAGAGKIVLVVSHDREFMQDACDRILMLGEKEVQA